MLASLVFQWCAIGSSCFFLSVRKVSHFVVFLLSHWKYIGNCGLDAGCWVMVSVTLQIIGQLAMSVRCSFSTLVGSGTHGEKVISFQVSLLLRFWYMCARELCTPIQEQCSFCEQAFSATVGKSFILKNMWSIDCCCASFVLECRILPEGWSFLLMKCIWMGRAVSSAVKGPSLGCVSA